MSNLIYHFQMGKVSCEYFRSSPPTEEFTCLWLRSYIPNVSKSFNTVDVFFTFLEVVT